MKVHNYSAGPCILPQEVLEKSAQAILDFNGSGLSLLEISHRSSDFVEVMEKDLRAKNPFEFSALNHQSNYLLRDRISRNVDENQFGYSF